MKLAEALFALAVGFLQLTKADTNFETSQAPADTTATTSAVVKANKVFKETLGRRQQQMYVDDSVRVPPTVACTIAGIAVLLFAGYVIYTRFGKARKSIVLAYEPSKQEAA
ncbi:hypothetical protein LPJ59_006264 [Coemansia sp. RSA 2399]|nr:hypothetical protein LPJ59_006264 [Coemansia sp. RSA 2399]KAJ1889054.1 hypothetical protein LPJ81_006204 [Coemansia sp. IMI 209127]